MSQLMDILRGPALGVVFMIILLAGVIIITAFAALIAQTSLLLRLKPWQTSNEQSSAKSSPQVATAPERQRSPSEHPRRGQVVVYEPKPNEVIDADGWQEVR